MTLLQSQVSPKNGCGLFACYYMIIIKQKCVLLHISSNIIMNKCLQEVSINTIKMHKIFLLMNMFISSAILRKKFWKVISIRKIDTGG